MMDAGSWMLGAGCWGLGAGCWGLATRDNLLFNNTSSGISWHRPLRRNHFIVLLV